MMVQRRYSLAIADVPLSGGTVLRIGVYRTGDGAPIELTLALGWGSEGAGLPPVLQDPLLLPGEALPGLQDALAALSGEPTPYLGAIPNHRTHRDGVVSPTMLPVSRGKG